MKKLVIALALAAALSGCAALQKLESVYQDVSGATVSPQTVYVAVNAFDAAKATATQYFNYCRTNLTMPICSANNRRTVLKYVRAGTAARNQLETYLQAGSSAPSAIFNTLKAALDSLQTSAIASGAQ